LASDRWGVLGEVGIIERKFKEERGGFEHDNIHYNLNELYIALTILIEV